ncbi:MAG: hypothetical protein GX318_04365 [Clostridia bacterium]|nr:hypothetical protein [Clostridia bacterium]
MRLQGMRFWLIAISIAVILMLLFAGHWLYNKYFLEQPVEEVLNKLLEVEHSDFNRETGKIELTLRDDINLQKTYRKIIDSLEDMGLSDNYKITITDKRNGNLEDVFYNAQFSIYQGIMQGDFINMNYNIDSIVGESDIDRYAVYIDNENVYLQFHKDKYYLYEIIKRSMPLSESINIDAVSNSGG